MVTRDLCGIPRTCRCVRHVNDKELGDINAGLRLARVINISMYFRTFLYVKTRRWAAVALCGVNKPHIINS